MFVFGGYAKRKLRSRFANICESYRHTIERMWELNKADGYWVAEEIGGVYDNAGVVTLSLLEMIYCVENDIKLEEVLEWQDYNIEAQEYGFNCINLKSWHKGCPRVPREKLEEFRAKRRELEQMAEEAKEHF